MRGLPRGTAPGQCPAAGRGRGVSPPRDARGAQPSSRDAGPWAHGTRGSPEGEESEDFAGVPLWDSPPGVFPIFPGRERGIEAWRTSGTGGAPRWSCAHTQHRCPRLRWSCAHSLHKIPRRVKLGLRLSEKKVAWAVPKPSIFAILSPKTVNSAKQAKNHSEIINFWKL